MLSTFIFAGAERGPERLAIVCNGRRLTYGELACAIEATIQAFERQGIGGPGYAVLAVQDLLQFWICSLALRELGLTTVAAQSAENAAALGLDDVRLVLTDTDPGWPGLEALCARNGWPLVFARWDGALARPVEAGRPRAPAVGEHVLQTSATTGAYKKVVMARSFERAFLNTRRVMDRVDEDSRQALFNFGGWTGAGYKSAGSVWLAGGAIVLDQGDLRRCLTEPGVSHAIMLPEQIAHVVETDAGREIPFRPGMRLFVGGATPRQALVDMARERLTPLVYNSLGCTEAITYAETLLERDEDRRWHTLRLDRDPHVVDDDDNRLPPGEIGRIRVSTRDGPTSYLGDDAATAAFFKDGYFYPGDLGLIREDGRMALMGRVTDVINIAGHKVSPAPLEDDLTERLGVSGVCLFSRQNDSAEEVAHVVIEAEAPLDTARLTAALKATLGGFPSARVHYMRRLPRNGMGKLMRTDIQRQVR